MKEWMNEWMNGSLAEQLSVRMRGLEKIKKIFKITAIFRKLNVVLNN